MKKLFLDSNMIIFHLEGKLNLSELRSNFRLYANPIVFSEVFIVYLKALTGKKSYELKSNPNIISEKEKELDELKLLFEIFEILEINKDVQEKAFCFIMDYGMLPNDALILATAKHFDMDYLISYDSDLQQACSKEKISLIDEESKLEHINKQ